MKVLKSVVGANVESVRQLVATVNSVAGVSALELSLSTSEGEIEPRIVARHESKDGRVVAVCRQGLSGRESRSLQMLFSALEALTDLKLILRWGEKHRCWMIIHEK